MDRRWRELLALRGRRGGSGSVPLRQRGGPEGARAGNPGKGRTTGTWNCHLPALAPGQLYGYRVHGDYDPASGRRFDPHKLLLDPYAKGIGRSLAWADALFGYTAGAPAGDLGFDTRDRSRPSLLSTASSSRPSTGAMTDDWRSLGTIRPSTKPTSAASPRAIHRPPLNCEEPMLARLRRRPSSTCSNLG
jgi:hypothetical protein